MPSGTDHGQRLRSSRYDRLAIQTDNQQVLLASGRYSLKPRRVLTIHHNLVAMAWQRPGPQSAAAFVWTLHAIGRPGLRDEGGDDWVVRQSAGSRDRVRRR